MFFKKRDSEIDLREVEPPRIFGRPQDCPECGSAAILDRIDTRSRIQYQHCAICQNVFSISESELLTANPKTHNPQPNDVITS